jgi:hypothetical protein
MIQEPEPMRQIHEIRLKMHEEEKNLSIDERVERDHKEASEIIQRYGLKLVTKKIKAA